MRETCLIFDLYTLFCSSRRQTPCWRSNISPHAYVSFITFLLILHAFYSNKKLFKSAFRICKYTFSFHTSSDKEYDYISSFVRMLLNKWVHNYRIFCLHFCRLNESPNFWCLSEYYCNDSNVFATLNFSCTPLVCCHLINTQNTRYTCSNA